MQRYFSGRNSGGVWDERRGGRGWVVPVNVTRGGE